jgi:hypothetical protein
LPTAFPVFTACSIQASFSQPQALDRLSADDVGFDNLINIGFADVPVPHGIGIDDQIRAVLALIEATRLIGPYLAFEAAFREFLFE